MLGLAVTLACDEATVAVSFRACRARSSHHESKCETDPPAASGAQAISDVILVELRAELCSIYLQSQLVKVQNTGVVAGD